MMLFVTDWRKSIGILNYKIEITSLAEQDLEDAADYIAFELKNPVAAVNMVKGIRKQINSLKTFPECNELDEDSILAEFGIRMDYYKNYKIYYVIERDVIIVIRILHMLVNSRVWLYRTLGLNS